MCRHQHLLQRPRCRRQWNHPRQQHRQRSTCHPPASGAALTTPLRSRSIRQHLAQHRGSDLRQTSAGATQRESIFSISAPTEGDAEQGAQRPISSAAESRAGAS